jgi:hypothetical protein
VGDLLSTELIDPKTSASLKPAIIGPQGLADLTSYLQTLK